MIFLLVILALGVVMGWAGWSLGRRIREAHGGRPNA